MSRPPERDFSDFVSSMPVGGENEARLLLWQSIERERSTRLRRRSTRRATLLGLTVFTAWVIAPVSPDSGNALLGLASAVAEAGPFAPGAPEVWYEKIERIEQFEVAPEHVKALGVAGFTFGVPTVVETWIGADGAYRTRIAYGTPHFSDGADERIFDLVRLGDRYPVNRVVESIGVVEDPVFEPPWADGPVAVLASMQRQVRTTTDPRPDSAQLLDLAVTLLREERDVPAHRATLFQVLAEIDGLAVYSKPGELVVAVRYVADQQALEKRIALDVATGALLSSTLERLATSGSQGSVVESRTFAQQAS
jgi:hypothetical protein